MANCPIYRLGDKLYGDCTGQRGISYELRQLTPDEAQAFVDKVIQSDWYLAKRTMYGIYPNRKPYVPDIHVVFSDVVQSRRGFFTIATCQRYAWVKPGEFVSWTTHWKIIVWALRGGGTRSTIDTHTLLHEICHTIDIDAAYSGCQGGAHSSVFVDNLAEAEQLFGDLGGRRFNEMLRAHGVRRAGPRRRQTLAGRVHSINSALRVEVSR